jgi:hypothetical protein
LLDADSQTFKKNKRQGHVRFSLFSPAEYQKTKEQQEALKAFMFLNDNAREFCMARPESTFAKAYKI